MATQKRKGIGKKTRFEVFKRDAFKCQYCGKCAPDVILEVDHIHPVSKGGDNDLLNYITACRDCNAGKSDRLLSDDSALAKQRAMLEELNERREQLEQMLAWRDGMRDLDGMQLTAALDAWHALIVGYKLNEKGEAGMRKLLAEFGLQSVLDAMPLCEKYLERDDEGDLTQESVTLAFRKLGGVAQIRSQPDWMQELRYICGIARNRFYRCDDRECLSLLEQAYEAGATIKELKAETLRARSWGAWCSAMETLIGQG